LTHQFFLSEFSLNLLVVDVNRYAIGDDTKGKIDVVAYELQQHFGYDIREVSSKVNHLDSKIVIGAVAFAVAETSRGCCSCGEHTTRCLFSQTPCSLLHERPPTLALSTLCWLFWE
jgi:hypothetical protein